MGTVGFLRSGYAALWLVLLIVLGGGVWWMVFRAEPPEGLGPVPANEVKTEALGAEETVPVKAQKRPEPDRAFLDEAELSISSADGSTKLDLTAREAEKDGTRYRLKQGLLNLHSEDVDHLQLEVTDGTYNVEAGVAYVEGSMQGQIVGTGQSFSAERLRWNQRTNIVHAEAVRLRADSLIVDGELMKILLPSGVVEFEGPVRARLSEVLGS